MELVYDGYTLRPANGGEVHTIATDYTRRPIVLSVRAGQAEAAVLLTPDEARVLATNLLRDVGLVVEGSG